MSTVDGSSGIANRCRRFTLLDGMLLIATIATWLGGLRAWIAINAVVWMLELPDSHGSGAILFLHEHFGRVSNVLVAVNEGALYLLAVVLLSGFYLYIRLHRPRPPWKRLMVQPGMLICLMVPIAYLIAAWFVEPRYTTSNVVLTSEIAIRSYILSAFLACGWFAACFLSRSTIEAGWIERLGRLLGIGWVGIGPVNFVVLNLL